MEERHKCKLCSRSFANGRALGGHMKAHLATFPLPPPKSAAHHQLGSRDSVSSSSSDDEDEKPTSFYGLRENPKKSLRLADREFSVAVDNGSISIGQDRESETESKNPTRRRSKRTRRLKIESNHQPLPRWPESSPEPASSISNTSPEEHVAICLVMLSMDKPISINNGGKDQTPESKKSTPAIEGLEGNKSKRSRARNRCERCQKCFRSNRALCGHRKICRNEEDDDEEEEEDGNNGGNWKIFKCPYCCKVFGSGQALGGHKRSHLPGSTRTAIDGRSSKLEISLDLNLPAPVEEDDYSVVSDA